uniref:hypothetical protein n=2 Tax=Neptunomonas phycophila TaxID=1572645 RepID=UPI003514757D
ALFAMCNFAYAEYPLSTKETRSNYTLSEKQWESRMWVADAINEVDSEVDSQISAQANKVARAKEVEASYKYTIKLTSGALEPQINNLAMKLGFRGGFWNLGNYEVMEDKVIGGNTPAQALDSILELTGYDGVITIYTNQIVSFKEQL